MANLKVVDADELDASFTNIANAIREKTNSSAPIYRENMPAQIRSIQSGSEDTAGIDQGVVNEANRVVSSVLNKIAANSVTFIAMSDMHEMGDSDHGTQSIVDEYRLANAHAGQAAELIAKKIKTDFFVNLGDFAWGLQTYTVHDMAQSITNARVKTGGLERLTKCFATPGNHDIGYRAGSFDENLVKAMIGNYQYADFDDKKIRVIIANTSDISDGTDRASGVSGEQLQWFVEALDLSSKSNASSWRILIFSHHPLDWDSTTMPLANCVAKYLQGGTYSATHDGISVLKNYSGKNSAKIVGTFHGHVHCFRVGDLSTTTGDNPVKRIAIPNACNGRNNEYGRDGNTTFGEPAADTCPSGKDRKSTTPGQDTAFCVVTIDLDEEIIYADCFGSLGDTAPGSHAGYDRVISYGVEEIVFYSISNNLTNANNSNGSSTVQEGSPYTATITPYVEYELKNVSVTMGGVDITSTVYSNGNINISSVTGNIVITVTTTMLEDFDYGTFTNLVPLSEQRDSTAIYGEDYNGDGVADGYKNGVYCSDSSDTTSNGMVSTGYIPYTWSPSNVLYIKGATLDTSNSAVRIYGYYNKTSVNNSVGYTSGTRITERFTVETLGDKYYKLTPKTTAGGGLTHIRISLVGTGENLIVTINEQIHAATGTTNYSVTNQLNFVTNSNKATSLVANSAYTATLTADNGYTLDSVTVTMGGTDVTSQYYSNGSINITSVTGDVVITATAKKDEVVATYTNLVPTLLDLTDPTSGKIFNGIGYMNGKYISTTSPYYNTDTATVTTGFLPYTKDTQKPIYVKGVTYNTGSHDRLGYHDSSYAGVRSTPKFTEAAFTDCFSVETLNADKTYFKITPKAASTINTKLPRMTHIAFSFTGTGNNMIITLNEPIE